jgi:hypothetical protein
MLFWRLRHASSVFDFIEPASFLHRHGDHGDCSIAECAKVRGRTTYGGGEIAVLGLFVVSACFILTRQITNRSRLTDGPASTKARPLSFLHISDSMRFQPPPRETKNPQRNMPIGILGGLAICTLIYVIVGAVATGIVPYKQLKAADPLSRALELANLPSASWIVAFGAVISLTAVLLVFQYGQPRILFAMARDGLLPRWAAKVHPKFRTPTSHGRYWTMRRRRRLVFRRERNIRPHEYWNTGRLRHCLCWCACVALFRSGEAATVSRPSIATGGGYRCGRLPLHDERSADFRVERFGIWLVLGLVLYFAYGYRHSTLRHGAPPAPVAPPPPLER